MKESGRKMFKLIKFRGIFGISMHFFTLRDYIPHISPLYMGHGKDFSNVCSNRFSNDLFVKIKEEPVTIFLNTPFRLLVPLDVEICSV